MPPDLLLCGRDLERSRLQSVTSAVPGTARGGVVVGPSGLGKTQLLAAAANDAKEDGAVVFSGSCLNVGDTWPLHPLREAAEQISVDYGNLPAAGRLVDALEGRVAPGSTADIVAAVHTELSELSRTRRLVLVIDDLQWVDSSTIRLVRTLLSGLTPGSISLLGGLRTDGVETTDYTSLLVEFHSSPVVEVIELEPLSEASTREMARLVSDRPMSPQRSHQLWKRSGGVPMLVKALAAHDDNGPDTLRSIRVVLAAKIDDLGSAARELVRLASLGIGPVDHDVAKVVLGLDDDQLLTAVHEAVSAGIVVSVGSGYSPVHDLFREIVQENLIRPERIWLHRRIAEAIESGLRDDEPNPIELAHHWAGANDGERALPSFVEAARLATSQGASIEAWQWWQNVTAILSELSAVPDLVGLLAEAAEAAHGAQENDAALELVDWAQRVEPSRSGRSGLRFAQARYLASCGKHEAAEAVSAELFNDPQTSSELAIEAGALSADLLTRLGQHEAAVKRATATIERSSHEGINEIAQLLATSALGYAQACLGRPESARRKLSEALQSAVLNGNPSVIEAASRHYADILMGPLNDLEAGVALAEKQAQHLLSHGGEQRSTTLLLAAATTGLFRLGRWQDGRQAATAALESDPTGAGVIELLLGRLRVVIGLGDFDAADRDLQAASSLLGSDPNPVHDLQFSTLRAGLAMWRGDIETARTVVRSAIERADAKQVDDPWVLAPLLWHGLRAEALSKASDVAWAFRLFVKMTDIRDGINTENTESDNTESDNTESDNTESDNPEPDNLLQGYFLLCAGELDRIRECSRPAIWCRAVEVWDECGHPYPAAYARMHQAEAMFSERTRNLKAEIVLRSAHNTVEGLGAKPLAVKLKGLALRARIDLDREPEELDAEMPTAAAVQNKLSVLTAREHEIIVEVAQGLSNREIGERLYISGRTVGVHISNILSKLGLKTRVEAAAVYLRETADSSS